MSELYTSTNDQDVSRLVIVSNRLPVTIRNKENDSWEIIPGSGGLVTALSPIMSQHKGAWIGWSGISSTVELKHELEKSRAEMGYELKLVPLSNIEVQKYYLGFSNEILWPLFHDLQSRCYFDPEYWVEYQSANSRFADIVAENTEETDFVWVHDYHLMLVAKELKNMGAKRKTAFFLHTPFPSIDIYIKLPWHSKILKAILEYDLIGFQTIRDRNNFLQSVCYLMKNIRCDARKRISNVIFQDRKIQVGVFPISIDYNEFAGRAMDRKVTKHSNLLKQALRNRKIILGVERLDYSKGIPERLKAFRNALHRYSDLVEKVTFVQIVVPSRGEIPEYNDLKNEIEMLVSEINGEFTQPGWVPVHYMYRSLKRGELIAYYKASDIALVTPLKDGMNLIAKEYCAAKTQNNGVLILSRFAGASYQLGKNSLQVNPYDIEGCADAIYRAYTMEEHEIKSRMVKLRKSIKKRDIYWWADSFLTSAGYNPQ